MAAERSITKDSVRIKSFADTGIDIYVDPKAGQFLADINRDVVSRQSLVELERLLAQRTGQKGKVELMQNGSIITVVAVEGKNIRLDDGSTKEVSTSGYTHGELRPVDREFMDEVAHMDQVYQDLQKQAAEQRTDEVEFIKNYNSSHRPLTIAEIRNRLKESANG